MEMIYKTNNLSDRRYEFSGGKLVHELMIDILGGLIPGALFLFSIILSIVFPIICYANPNENLDFIPKNGDWFWIVMFFVFLILSYVIGHIFYRADIKEPDRLDIRREQKKTIDNLLKNIPHEKAKACLYLLNLIKDEINPLEKTLDEFQKKNQNKIDAVYNEQFLKNCKSSIEVINDIIGWLDDFNPENEEVQKNIIESFNTFDEKILLILFPEGTEMLCKKSNTRFYKYLSADARNTLESFRRILPACRKLFDPQNGQWSFKLLNWKDINKKQNTPDSKGWINSLSYAYTKDENGNDVNQNWLNNFLDNLIIVYLILHLQNESGCATEARCDFPYLSYYKYLLKRNKQDILGLVKWTSPSSRTKNQINDYKIRLQTNVPYAYSIITKNESHIRMASSTWHVAKKIKTISVWTLCITGVLFVLSLVYWFGISVTNYSDSSAEITEKYFCCYRITDVSKVNPIPESNTQIEHIKIIDSKFYQYIVEFITKVFPFIAKKSLTNSYLAFIFPLLTLLLMIYIINHIPFFIHYQRLREIYYTLNVYNLWLEARCEQQMKERLEINRRRAQVKLPPLGEEEFNPFNPVNNHKDIHTP